MKRYYKQPLNYPRKHFQWVKFLGSCTILAFSIAFGYTEHWLYALGAATTGVTMLFLLDERRF
jgi:hypothetical protein